jgi:hypothetical protein
MYEIKSATFVGKTVGILFTVGKTRGLSPRAKRPPLFGEISAKFCGIEGATWSASRILTAVFSSF